jgi:hypothetical protein
LRSRQGLDIDMVNRSSIQSSAVDYDIPLRDRPSLDR